MGIEIMLFWIVQAWILWLLLIFDVLRYEVHMPLVIIGMTTAGIGMMSGLFPWELLGVAISFFASFYLMYRAAKAMVRVKYHVKEEGI